MLQFVNIVQSETQQINRYINKILGIGQFISSLHHVLDPIETSKTEHQMENDKEKNQTEMHKWFHGNSSWTIDLLLCWLGLHCSRMLQVC